MLNGQLNDTQAAVQLQPPEAVNNKPALPWYVCFTKPRQEQYAASKLLEQGYEVYLPMLESWARQSSNWRKKQTVMFPRYGFVRPERASQTVRPIASTPGVSGLVRFGTVPATLADERLQALRGLPLVRANAMPRHPFNIGQQVMFCNGPLKGAGGLVSSVSAERVTVLMSLLGQSHSVSTPARDLAQA
jgi:transcriptional antiterminator RfaH